MEEKRTKDNHKGSFVGGYFTDEHLEKISEVEKLYDEHFGEPGRNRSRALRYIVDCFRPEWLQTFPKSPAPVGMTAQTETAMQ